MNRHRKSSGGVERDQPAMTAQGRDLGERPLGGLADRLAARDQEREQPRRCRADECLALAGARDRDPLVRPGPGADQGRVPDAAG